MYVEERKCSRVEKRERVKGCKLICGMTVVMVV